MSWGFPAELGGSEPPSPVPLSGRLAPEESGSQTSAPRGQRRDGSALLPSEPLPPEHPRLPAPGRGAEPCRRDPGVLPGGQEGSAPTGTHPEVCSAG